MAAYIIFDVEVTDPTAADDYLKLANESLTPFQSKTIVHGGVVEVLEGDWEPESVLLGQCPCSGIRGHMSTMLRTAKIALCARGALIPAGRYGHSFIEP